MANSGLLTPALTASLRRLATQRPAGEVVLYVDEVDLHLNPKIGPDWMLPGTQREVMTRVRTRSTIWRAPTIPPTGGWST